MRFEAVFFDLDGTLVDSIEDLALAVNYVRRGMGLEPLGRGQVSGFVGDGAKQLLVRSFRDCPRADLPLVFDLWSEYYLDHCLDNSRPYAGVEKLLEGLSGAPRAIVSNKPKVMVDRIVDGLGWRRFFSVIFGGDSLDRRKPDPLPLRSAAESLGVGIHKSVMVGDGVPDILAAQRAGCASCAVAYGFSSMETLVRHQPSALLKSPSEVLTWLG